RPNRMPEPRAIHLVDRVVLLQRQAQQEVAERRASRISIALPHPVQVLKRLLVDQTRIGGQQVSQGVGAEFAPIDISLGAIQQFVDLSDGENAIATDTCRREYFGGYVAQNVVSRLENQFLGLIPMLVM